MRTKSSERGGARLKFIIAILVFAGICYTGYLYFPIAIDAYYFKDAMQTKVDLAATQGFEPPWIRDQLEKSKADFHAPPEAIIPPPNIDNRLEVRVQFTRPISF